MGVLTINEPDVGRAEPPQAEASAPTLFGTGEVALEDVVLRAWEDLAAERRTECLVCGGRLTARDGCEDCGAELS